MKQQAKTRFLFGGTLLLSFLLLTWLVSVVDVQSIGPEGSIVGFATVNQWVFRHVGVHPLWYTITDWLGLLPFFTAAVFAALGLYQLMKRKRLRKVDGALWALGALYGAVAAVYLLFERVVINFRPVILSGELEASYPSSHTLLVVSVMASAPLALQALYPYRRKLSAWARLFSALVIALTVVGRLLSGVHWLTDIFAGVLLAWALVEFYRGALTQLTQEEER